MITQLLTIELTKHSERVDVGCVLKEGVPGYRARSLLSTDKSFAFCLDK